ncbi:DUF1254 domain-containing protein [Terriglobus roseus]|uniref:DUF1254 domain-containing protein n=1 Tax=Terriglobus roseus TaxID=392734 RepID=A0A1G7PJX8_9BACT|nr:DUF1254 domain-containing protein [Terriglobus roseus]SDF86672.1 Protein of unknown function [Terriglobus roseus]
MARNKFRLIFIALPVALAVLGCEQPKPVAAPSEPAAQTAAAKPEPPKCSDCVTVTPQTFPRAETDLYFGNFVKDGALGKFINNRTPTPIDKQKVVRMNRDTLYSSAVLDLDAGPVTITLPDPGKRFLSMQIVNEDEYTPMVVYSKGAYTLTKEKIGTRYAAVLLRILADPNSTQDLDEVHKLQDAVTITQKAPGTFEAPKWDQASQDKIREALVALGSTITDFKNAFGTKQQVDPVNYLIGSAAGWGGNPDKDATYAQMKVPNNDGKQVYKLTVKDVPVDGFWSISVYNAKGYFEQNSLNAYSINNITAQKNADNSVTVQFGGCENKAPNCVPITPGWNATIRMYRPRTEITSGKWKFPEVQPAT